MTRRSSPSYISRRAAPASPPSFAYCTNRPLTKRSCMPIRRSIRTETSWRSMSSPMLRGFQSLTESPIATATCSTVTIVVGDSNQPVPRMLIRSVCAVRSASSKYRVILVVECASNADSMQQQENQPIAGSSAHIANGIRTFCHLTGGYYRHSQPATRCADGDGGVQFPT
jgi:hypothetical protein